MKKLIAILLLVFPLLVLAQPQELKKGWNLIGNPTSIHVNTREMFEGHTEIISIWSWNNPRGWYFYSPSLSYNKNAEYVQQHGLWLLGTVAPGEGIWVNVLEDTVITWPTAWNFDQPPIPK